MRAGGAYGVQVRRVGDPEDVHAAGHLFDHPPDADATRRFLATPGHHLLICYHDDVPVGMVSGIEMTHPDKGTEMFLYELGVAEQHRGRGFGRALVSALAELARSSGCYGMWVLTDPGNAAALAAYRAAGGRPDGEPQRMLSWDFGSSS